MKRNFIIISILAAFLLLVGFIVFVPVHAANQFIDDSFSKLRDQDYSPDLPRYEYSDGSFMTFTVEHSCCSGNGYYDAVAVRTSAGSEYYSRKNYCGNEGFGSFVVSGSTNLDELDSILLEAGFHKN